MENIVKTTLSEQIYTILRDDIISQRIRCGEKLTLKMLQERFGLSSTPIREAMGRLGREGLIDHVTNVGAKVVDLGEKDVEEIYDFCAVLDISAMRFALEGPDCDQVKDELRKNIEMQEKALNSENMKEFMAYSDNFHDIFFRHADNSRLYDASMKIRSQFSILATRYQNYTIAKSIVFIEHKNITESIFNFDYENAYILMNLHFDHAKKYLIDNIREDQQIE